MKKGISEICELVNSQETEEEMVNILHKFGDNNVVFQGLMRMNWDKDIVWDVPPGAPPFKSIDTEENYNVLYSQFKKLYVFWHPKSNVGGSNIPQKKKETLYISMLEGIAKKDAELMIAIKDGTLNKLYPKLTPQLLNLAWPGLMPEYSLKKHGKKKD